MYCDQTKSSGKAGSKTYFALVSHIVRDFKFCLRNQRVAAKIGLKNFSSCWCRCNLKGSNRKDCSRQLSPLQYLRNPLARINEDRIPGKTTENRHLLYHTRCTTSRSVTSKRDKCVLNRDRTHAASDVTKR